jgi:hypothetical protein
MKKEIRGERPEDNGSRRGISKKIGRERKGK